MIARMVSAVFLAAGVAAGTAARADIAAGQAKAKQVCAACHSERGDKPLQPQYPILAGQYRDYLYKALRDYQSGARKNPIMSAMAKPLTTEEMQDVAEWFSSQQGPLHVKR